MERELTIDQRFRGPPGSANGGYTCGVLADYLGVSAEVTLRTPPPLGRPLRVETGEQEARLMDNSTLIAEAKVSEPEIDPPDTVTYEEAAAISTPTPPDEHPFPECFVCGPLRQRGDGLRIYPQRLDERQLVVASWLPDESLSDGTGSIRDEFIWAALDCPGGFAVWLLDPQARCLLGRLRATIVGHVSVGDRLVVMGWPVEKDGRKFHAGTAVFSEHGELKGLAQATWINLRHG